MNFSDSIATECIGWSMLINIIIAAYSTGTFYNNISTNLILL